MASNGSDENQMNNSLEPQNKIASSSHVGESTNGSVISEVLTKENLFKLAENAAEELLVMTLKGEPLWTYVKDLDIEFLDRKLYNQLFNKRGGEEMTQEIINQSMTFEASWARATVVNTPIELLDMLMDVEQWVDAFPNIVASATLVEKLSRRLEDGNHDGVLLVMKAEFGLPTPFLETREFYFLRYCKKCQESNWLVVDVSLDNPHLKFFRKPSGCLIEPMNGGLSKVTWVEHSEVSNGSVHIMFEELVSSGFAFCASRWLYTLKRQMENQKLIKEHIQDHDGGRLNLLKLAYETSRSCMKTMNSSMKHIWSSLPSIGGAENIYVTRNNCENNLAVTTSVRLSVSADYLYDCLRCSQCRTKWDMVALGGVARKELHISTTEDDKSYPNYVSMVHVEPTRSNEEMKCLQVSFTDSIGYYIAWTYIDMTTMNSIMEEGNPNDVRIVHSGFAIYPYDPMDEEGEYGGGSVLTVAFQIVDNDCMPSLGFPDPDLEAKFKFIINKTISLITNAFIPPHQDDDFHDTDDI